MNPDLSTATIEELADELIRRSKGVFIVGRPLAENPNGPNWFHFYGGDTDTVLGVVEIGKARMMQRVCPLTLEDVT